MTPAALASLAETADAFYQARLARLQPVLAEESRLRGALADLDLHRARNAGLPAPDMAGVRAVGAEVLWQGWVGRMRADLNAQLARVLVRKAAHLDDLRQAFGRAEATRALLATAGLAQRRARQARATQDIEALMQLQARSRSQTS